MEKLEERKKFGDRRKTDTNIKFLCFWFKSEEGKKYIKKILDATKEYKKQVLLREEKDNTKKNSLDVKKMKKDNKTSMSTWVKIFLMIL